MIAIILFILLFPTLAIRATSGIALFIDGDTIQIAGQRIRLYGIDATESNHLCQRKGGPWQCGAEAAETLKEIISGSIVLCYEKDADRYGRIVTICKANGTDINAAMVLSGMALAYRKYSSDYISHEASAKVAGRGLWTAQFIPPWEWRRGKRLTSEGLTVDNKYNCRIKGYINSKGARIYHMPNNRWYAKTVITISKGERWFRSEDKAIRAGWRRAGASAYTKPSFMSMQQTGTTLPFNICGKLTNLSASAKLTDKFKPSSNRLPQSCNG